MTKNGKEVKLDLAPNYSVVYGTIDNKNAKTVYLNISAWGEPTEDTTMDYGRVISKLGKCVKQSTYNYLSKCEPMVFQDKYIMDLDMRESGIKFGKRSYMSCEMNLFYGDHATSGNVLNDEPTIEALTELAKEAIGCLEDFQYFKFHKKKK